MARRRRWRSGGSVAYNHNKRHKRIRAAPYRGNDRRNIAPALAVWYRLAVSSPLSSKRYRHGSK